MQDEHPKTVEDFILSPWFRKIRTTIIGFHLREDPEDTMQDILLQLYKKGYLARYNVEKGSMFSTWIYTFVHNMLRCKWNRSHTRGGRAIEGAVSLYAITGQADSGQKPLVTMLPTRHFSVMDFNSKLEEVELILQHPKFKAHSYYTWPHGVTYARDMKTVFSLIAREGLGVAEIACLFDTSPTFVQGLVVKIRPIVKHVFEVYRT